jgi:hypothetical protein
MIRNKPGSCCGFSRSVLVVLWSEHTGQRHYEAFTEGWFWLLSARRVCGWFIYCFGFLHVSAVSFIFVSFSLSFSFRLSGFTAFFTFSFFYRNWFSLMHNYIWFIHLVQFSFFFFNFLKQHLFWVVFLLYKQFLRSLSCTNSCCAVLLFLNKFEWNRSWFNSARTGTKTALYGCHSLHWMKRFSPVV